MKYLSFLLIFIFSPFIGLNGGIGKMEIGKQGRSEEIVSPKTAEVEKDSLAIAIKVLSDWQVASGTYYNPKDSSQTRRNTDGVGAFGRAIESGSIALGSTFTKFFLEKKEKIKIYVEIKNLNVITPFGKGIFRVDDSMGKCSPSAEDFFLDFHEEDLTSYLKRVGRFDVVFRIYKIEES